MHFIDAIQRIETDNVCMPVIMHNHIHFGYACDFIVDLDAVQVLRGKIMPIVEVLHGLGLSIIEFLGLGSHIIQGVQQETAGAAGGIYKDAVSDTNEKPGPSHPEAGNIKKSRAFTVPPVIPAEL